MKLMREIRLSGVEPRGPMHNSWAGWPEARHVAAYLTLRAVVEGQPNPHTGYLCDIRKVDTALRAGTLAALNDGSSLTYEQVLRHVWLALDTHDFDGAALVDITLRATPYLSYYIERGASHMIALTQSFEFSAAHRLYCRDLSDDANRELFGKCSNPNGHGHNYQIEVTVAGTPDDRTGRVMELSRFEGLVKEKVIDRFDHKHLNLDCPEFADLNPSVENITRVIWDRLDEQFLPAILKRVRVWETPKTCAEIER